MRVPQINAEYDTPSGPSDHLPLGGRLHFGARPFRPSGTFPFWSEGFIGGAGNLSREGPSCERRLPPRGSWRAASEGVFSSQFCHSLLDHLINPFADTAKIFPDVTIGESKEKNSLFAQQVCALHIISDLLLFNVLAAIQFNTESGGRTIKIQNVIQNRFLSPKTHGIGA